MKTGKSAWDERIGRAEYLAEAFPFAAEGLGFYRRLARLQQGLYSECQSSTVISALPGQEFQRLRDRNPAFLLPQFPAFLKQIAEFAPRPIAETASGLRAAPGRHETILSTCWQAACDFPEGPESTEALLAWMFLQPFAEFAAKSLASHVFNGAALLCPACFGKPLTGVLRPEGDGAKRSLICSLCLTEWPIGRIVCVACGEQDAKKLAVYTAEQFDYVRAETCDSCRSYIKTVDLSKNGHAVPIVDELATIPLNLWAAKHGYRKLRVNLLGI